MEREENEEEGEGGSGSTVSPGRAGSGCGHKTRPLPDCRAKDRPVCGLRGGGF